MFWILLKINRSNTKKTESNILQTESADSSGVSHREIQSQEFQEKLNERYFSEWLSNGYLAN